MHNLLWSAFIANLMRNPVETEIQARLCRIAEEGVTAEFKLRDCPIHLRHRMDGSHEARG
jgi:hypothetical protein